MDLPPEYASVHPNFHARLPKLFVANNTGQFPLREPPGPSPIIPEDNQYEVEEILEHQRGRRSITEYLVRWAGYGQEDDSCVSEGDINKGLIRAYMATVERDGQ